MLQELGMAWRALWRRRLFALSTIAILAVAVAAGIVVHSVVHAVLCRPHPFADPDAVVLVYAKDLSPTASPFAERGSAGCGGGVRGPGLPGSSTRRSHRVEE